jgi:O-antigen ligase
MINNALLFLKNYWSCFLILLAFVGFVSKSLYNYPMGIMALLGLYQIIAMPKILQDPLVKTFSLVFICIWLPLLLSLPDAVNLNHSAHTVFPYLRFFFAGIFIIRELSNDSDKIKFIVASIFYIVLFWCLDATIQFVFHKNLLGFPYEEWHITGMFYPRNTIAHICAILSSFSFIYIFNNFKKYKWSIISIIPLFFIILLSGRRAAWVMLALSTTGFLIYGFIYSFNRIKFITIFTAAFMLVTILLIITINFHSFTNERFKSTLGLFSSNYDTINHATAFRLPIWETSYTIFKSNPINGIGPRGFRYAYKDYASVNDMFVGLNDIPTQPHIIILEILTESGLIGFLCYLFSFYLIIRVLQTSTQKKSLSPYFIPVLVAMFPFNTHMAFYGSIWSSMIWLLIALYFAQAKLASNNN